MPTDPAIAGWRHRDRLDKTLDVLGDEHTRSVFDGVPEDFTAQYVDQRADFARLQVRGFDQRTGKSGTYQVHVMPWERDVLIEELTQHQAMYPRGQKDIDSPIRRLDATIMKVHGLIEDMKKRPGAATKKQAELTLQMSGLATAWRIMTGSEWSGVHPNANGWPLARSEDHTIPAPGIYGQRGSTSPPAGP